MPSPESSLATLRPDLGGSFEEFDLMMQRAGFIATRVFPIFDAAKASGTFGVIPVEELLQAAKTERAPGGGYARGDWTFQTATFATKEHGWEEPVDDNQRQLYSEWFDAELVSTARAMNMVMANAEQRVADAVFASGTFNTTAVTTEWNTAATATPIADVEAAVQRVYDASGIWPDTIIMTRKVFRNLRVVDEVQAAISSSGAGSSELAGNITIAQVAQMFDLPKVLVGNSTKNTANEGAAASLSPIWDDEFVMVTKTADTNDISEPCIGRTIHWAEDGSTIEGTVETYRDESKRSDIVRVRHQVDELVLYAAIGELLSNITT